MQPQKTQSYTEEIRFVLPSRTLVPFRVERSSQFELETVGRNVRATPVDTKLHRGNPLSFSFVPFALERFPHITSGWKI